MHFVEIEGITGTGKTTLIPYLEKHLVSQGYSVFCVKEPGFTDLGLDIRQLLENKHYGNLSNLTILLLFLANRADIYEKHLKNHRYDIVLFDRYYGSTFVYQILMGDPHLKKTNHALLNSAMVQITGRKRPTNTTVLLDVNPEVALERIKKRQKTEFRSNHEITDDKVFLERNARLRNYFKDYFYKEKLSNHKIFIDSNTLLENVITQMQQALSTIDFNTPLK